MPLPYPTLPGDVDHLIANDHAVVNRLFEHVEAGRGDRRVLADQICSQLVLHSVAEERTFYPELRSLGRDDEAEKLIIEHIDVKQLVTIVEDGSPGEFAFEQALTTIIADVREHAAGEEAVFLPQLRRAVGPQRMAELGESFIAAKRTAPTYAHPDGPTGKIGHALLDAGAALIDHVRDRSSGRVKGFGTDASGLLDPQAQRIMDAYSALGPKPLEILKPATARRQPSLADAVGRILTEDGRSTEPETVGEVRNLTFTGPAGAVPVRVYAPTTVGTEPLPVILWSHGGGFVLFDVDTYDASCRGLVTKTGAIVVSPQYRRAPEHAFPASHDDVLATYYWIREHAGEFGGDPTRIAVGGESVGATMAAATCLQLHDAGEQLPVAQVLVYPLTTTELRGDSMSDSADAHPLNRPLLSWMAMHAFAGVPEAATDRRINLLGLTPDELGAMPPTLVITAERDVLRSQGEEFARHLEKAGVPSTLSRYDGVMHQFFGAAAVLDKAEQAQREAAAHLLAAFGSGPYQTTVR
jgi:acetyl esterase